MEQKVTDIQIVPIKPRSGLVGFASFIFDGSFYLSSIGIYTRPKGGFRLTYPLRKTPGEDIPIYYPINKEVARVIEEAVSAKFEKIYGD